VTVTRSGAQVLEADLLRLLADGRPRWAEDLASSTGRAALSVRNQLRAMVRRGLVRVTCRRPFTVVRT
jgi:predicted transcriptional regulator